MWTDHMPWLGERLIERRIAFFMSELVDDPGTYRVDFERWLSRGARRRQIYAEILRHWHEQGWDRGTDLPRPDVIAAVPPRTPGRGDLSPMLVAAVGALALVSWAGLDVVGKYPSAPTSPSAKSAQSAVMSYRTGPDESRSITLSDGSVISLRPGTILTVAMMPAARRLELLDGSARFQVAHDPNRPFTVWAGGGSTTATGTVFEVGLNSDRLVRIDLIEGHVIVMSPRSKADKSADRHTTRLAAGEHAIYGVEATEQGASRDPARADAAFAEEDIIHFEYEHLDSAIARLNQHSAVQIALADPGLHRLTVYGDCNLKDVAGFVKNLADGLDLDVDETPGRLVLKAKASPTK